MPKRDPKAASTWQFLLNQQSRMVKPALAQLRQLIGKGKFWGTADQLVVRLRKVQREYQKAIGAIPLSARGTAEIEAKKVFDHHYQRTEFWSQRRGNQRQRLKELSSWSMAMQRGAAIMKLSALGEPVQETAAQIIADVASLNSPDEPSIVDAIRDAKKDLFNISGNLAAAGLAVIVIILITRSK